MIEMKFRWLFGHFRLDMFPASDFLLGPRELDRLCEGVEAEKTAKKAKKAKSDPDWEPIHEATYSEFGVAWPPPCGPIDKFRDRESEVVFIVDKIWPDERLNVWTFFDANHTLQRCIKYPPHKSPQAKAKAKAKPLCIWEAAKSPWKDYVPTLTAGSSICARCITQSGGEGAAREKVLRRLHALECMAFQGWAPQMYKNKQHLFDSVSHQTLSSMAGNMWNSFAFMPVMLATLGAVNAHTDLAHGEPVADVDGDILDDDNGAGSAACSSEQPLRIDRPVRCNITCALVGPPNQHLTPLLLRVACSCRILGAPAARTNATDATRSR